MERQLGYSIQMQAIIFVAAIIILTAVLYIAAEWRILDKAGEKGWKALIPFYNVFVAHRITGMSHVWFISEVITWVVGFVLQTVPAIPRPLAAVFIAAAGIFTIICEFIHAIRLCNCFGKGTGFKIGMILLPGLFMMIIGFGKSEYQKPNH